MFSAMRWRLEVIKALLEAGASIDIQDGKTVYDLTENKVNDVINWIKTNNIKKLNVAGNGGYTKEEGTKVFKLVRLFLRKVFAEDS